MAQQVISSNINEQTEGQQVISSNINEQTEGQVNNISTQKNDDENKTINSKTDNGEEKEDLKLLLSSTTEFNNYPYNQSSDHFLFMSTVKAPFFRPNERAAIDLICVIDQSGSMGGERIKMVREVVTFIINNLENDDRFGIVGFHDYAETIYDLTKMDSNNKKKALTIVEKIEVKGSTALCDGLIAGIDLMRKRKKIDSNPIASVMLFTDGQANVGPTQSRDIIAAMKNLKYKLNQSNDNLQNNSIPRLQQQQAVHPQQKQGFSISSFFSKSSDNNNEEGKDKETKITKDENIDENAIPCSVNTFGFGEDHNGTLLSAIAESGRGMYAFIESIDSIADTFAQALGGLVSTVAQNIEFRFKIIGDVKINQCLSDGYKMETIKKNEEYLIIINDIQSEERRDIVWDLSLPKLNKMTDEFELGNITCNYTNAIHKKQESISLITVMKRGDDNSEIGERNNELDLQNNRIVAAKAMDNADQLAKGNNLKEGRNVINDAITKIQESKTKEDKYAKTLVKDLQKCLDGLVDKSAYKSSGEKMLNMNSKAHYQQRAVHSSKWESQEAYSNNNQISMKSKFKK